MADDFQELLNETGVVLTPPEGFIPCATRDNSVFAYQYAHRSPSGDLELRYRIDSIPRLKEQRRIANEGIEVLSSVDLNKLHKMAYMAALFNLSGGETRAVHEHTPEVAREAFGADWAAACFFPLADNGFAPGYDAAVASCFHKKDVADAYLIGVFKADDFIEGSNAYRLYGEPPGFRFV